MPSNLSLEDALFAFDLPADDAIEFFASKGYRITWDWDEMLGEAHRRAFTVAKLMKMSVLVTVREALERAQEEGWTAAQFRTELQPILAENGWWGRVVQTNPTTGRQEVVNAGTLHRLNVIYRQNMQSSYIAGRFRQQRELARRRPVWVYRAVQDNRTTSQCRSRDGIALPADHEFWAVNYPPNHFLCRAYVESMSAREAARQGIELTGDEDPVLSAIKPSKGFEAAPDQPYEPDLSRYPKKLVEQYLADEGE